MLKDQFKHVLYAGALLIAIPSAGKMFGQSMAQQQPYDPSGTPPQLKGMQGQPPPQFIVSSPLPPTAAAAVPVVKRAVMVDDVVAVWVKGSEYINGVPVGPGQSAGMKANPVCFVGIVSMITPTHVQLSSRKWWATTPPDAVKYMQHDMIPRDIIERVQVLGVAGKDKDAEVTINTTPTGEFSS